MAADNAATSNDQNLATDILDVRSTGDTSHFYMAVTFDPSSSADIHGDTSVTILVSIDTDLIKGSGQTSLGDSIQSHITTNAAWEYLAIADFSGVNARTIILNTSFDTTTISAAAISNSQHSIELSIPWTALDLTGGAYSQAPIRLTLSAFRSDSLGSIIDILGPDTSDVIDVVTNYESPGSSANTIVETSDDTIHYFFDLYFDSLGHVIAPLLISEVLYDPSGSEPAAEFIEVRNVFTNSINLAGFRVGDEETMAGGEGMYAFPAISDTIHQDSFVVVARDGAVFAGNYGFIPDYEMTSSSPAANMDTYLDWGSGGLSMGNGGDEVLLLDPCETVIDVVVWESASWPGLITDPPVNATNGKSIDRSASNYTDSDNMDNDFGLTENDGNPGAEGEAEEMDLDGDGVPDFQDNCPQKANVLQSDLDGDGTGDVCDTDFMTSNNIGIGLDSPKQRLHISGGNFFVDNTPGYLIMRSFNDKCWAMSITDTGLLHVIEIDCPVQD